MTGQMVEFPVNGTSAGGYLALPASTPAPGVIVLQEWWGLVPQIKVVCDRLAAEGLVALAPDLYHGEAAEHTEMDKANELMTNLPADRAARDMSGAIDYLLAHDSTRGDRVGAAAPFYGAPLDDTTDWSGLTAKVEGHFAENDAFFSAEPVKQLESKLRGMGKDVTFHVYPGTGHAFANEEDALGTYNAEQAAVAWGRTLAHLRANL